MTASTDSRQQPWKIERGRETSQLVKNVGKFWFIKGFIKVIYYLKMSNSIWKTRKNNVLYLIP